MAECCEDTIISVFPKLFGEIFSKTNQDRTDKFHLIAVIVRNHNAIVIRY